jgi:hypothetical protein
MRTRLVNAVRTSDQRQPSQFLLRELSSITVGGPRAERPRMRVAADSVAEFIGARGEDLVFVDNATAGVNAVLRSLEFKAGDEILLSDHAYGSVPKIAAFAGRRSGARVVTVELPPRALDPSVVVEAFDRALGPRTRLVILDHITSNSAWILPVAEIAALCRAKGVPTLVDGAHAPGAIPLNLPSLGVDWYSANPGFHEIPPGYGLPWGTPEEEYIPAPLVFENGWNIKPDMIIEMPKEARTSKTSWTRTKSRKSPRRSPNNACFQRADSRRTGTWPRAPRSCAKERCCRASLTGTLSRPRKGSRFSAPRQDFFERER